MDELQILINNPISVWLWSKLSEGIVKSLAEKAEDKISDKVLTKLLEKWEKIDWGKAESKYNAKLQSMYGWTNVLGKPDKISLDGIFTDVFVIDKPRAFQHYDISKLSADIDIIHENENRIGGLELVKSEINSKLFILGKPGAGKTTFLKFITYQATQGNLEKTPIFVPLKQWSDSNLDLMKFINRQFDICGFPEEDAEPFIEYLLEQGKAVILFDGLDEVNLEGNKRARINRSIEDFCYKYDENQVLITCRSAASEYVFGNFSYVELANFTEEQVEQYVDKWFSDQTQKRKSFKKELLQPENDRIRQLANTPILLSLLCLAFDNMQTFPSRKVEIYEEALDALLKKWDSSREIKRDEIYKDLSHKRKQQMLARIAARTFQDNEYFIPQKKIARYITEYISTLPNSNELDIDGEVILRSIEAQHGIFTERAKNIYSFSHLTFQEYFTSKHIIDNQTKDKLNYLLKTKHIIATKWREVILNTACLLDNADDFFNIFQHYNKHLIKENERIWDFVSWVETKSEEVQSNLESFKIRAFYFSLGASLYSARNIVFKSVNKIVGKYVKKKPSELIERLILEVSRDSPKNSILSNLQQNFVNYDVLSGNTVPIEDTDLWIDFQLWLHWTYAKIILNLQEDFPHIEFNVVFENEINDIQKTLPAVIEKLCKIYNDLEDFGIPQKLSYPCKDNTIEDWKGFSQLLFRILTEKRKINVGWNFSELQQETLRNYNYTTELLKSCLDLSVVSNRKFIESRLYTTLG